MTSPCYCKIGRTYCNFSRRRWDRPIDRDIVKFCRRFCPSPRGQERVREIVQQKAAWYTGLGLELNHYQSPLR